MAKLWTKYFGNYMIEYNQCKIYRLQQKIFFHKEL